MTGPDTRTPLPPQVLQALVEGVAARTGKEFFHELVRQVSLALGTKGVWVTEWLPENRRLRALAFWYDGAPFGDYEYAIAGTPCEPVVETCGLFHVEDRLIELFPDDPDLAPMNAVSYMGIPLQDTDGELLGHLAVLHDAPQPARPRTEAVFRIFAERAASELRRLRRERDLSDREAKLSALIGSAMDAILEVDRDLAVVGMNPAAEKAFGCTRAESAGRAIASLLAPASYEQLTALASELLTRRVGERSQWIPDGLEARTADGESFPVEATLSSFELHGEPCFTLILRNVDDRLAAEARIRELTRRAAYLSDEVAALRGFGEIVGESEALRATLSDVERVAARDTPVLITGETGTGKELIARAIHDRSPRTEGPLVKVNCAAIPENLQESEFFGHSKGAFTGATQARVGRFELAEGGTIFLDEVGDMPTDLQAKLLRVIQEGEFERVGSTETLRVDVRLVAATNCDLQAMVDEGTFRRDLFYRLNVFPIHLPPLRERGEDVVLLAEACARKLAERAGRRAAPLTEDAKARLRRYEWPGNVRELENVMERALITSLDGRTPNLERALPESRARADSPSVLESDDPRIFTVAELQTLERANLVRALVASAWKVSGKGGAAERLGLKPNTLSSRMRALGIEKPRKG
jgi:PAS domain S-box-containing protein